MTRRRSTTTSINAALGAAMVMSGGSSVVVGADPATTSPATAVGTAQSAAQPDADINDLIRQLSAGDWRQRQSAQSRLVQLAERARPQLEALLNRAAIDDETRNRAAAALRQIDDNDRTGASLVTLHVRDVEPLELFAQLSRQIKAPLEPAQPELWRAEHTPTGKMTFDADRQPFWAVMQELNRRYSIELVQWGEELRLTTGGGGSFPMRGPTSIDGPFLIVAARVNRSQSIDLSAGAVGAGAGNAAQPAPIEREFTVQLTALPEPKLRIRKSDSMARLSEAVDENGNSLLPEHADDEDHSGYTMGPAGMWSFNARLQDPKQNVGRRIVRLKGTVSTVLLTQFQTIEIGDVLTSQTIERDLGNSKLVIKGLKKDEQNAGVYHLTATVQLLTAEGNDTSEEWERIENVFNSGDARLLDAQGKPFGVQSRNIAGAGGQNNAMDIQIAFTRDFGPTPDAEANKIGEPAKLVVKIPTESKEVAVPFEFRDLPIP